MGQYFKVWLKPRITTKAIREKSEWIFTNYAFWIPVLTSHNSMGLKQLCETTLNLYRKESESI